MSGDRENAGNRKRLTENLTLVVKKKKKKKKTDMELKYN
jgi:hypothetical protein